MPCSHPLDPLFRTDHGAVYRCRRCGWFNTLFGPVVLAFGRRAFGEFRTLIDGLEPQTGPAHQIGERRYHLATPTRQVGLALTDEEVAALRELLAGAAAMDELEGLIDEALHGTPDD